MTPRSRPLALAAALVACSAPPAAPDRSATTPPAPVDPPPASSTPPPPPDDGARAFVADDTGLVEVALAGGARSISPAAVTWCGVDARGAVVWFVDERGLHAYDLVERRVRPILAADLGQLAVIVDWRTERLGGEDPLAFDVGVALRMTPAPTLAAVIGCDGDRAVYCYEEDGVTPTAGVEQAKRRAAALRFVDPAAVAAIAARGAAGSLWSPPPVPPVPPTRAPVVDRKRCTEAPEDCGTLIALPSSPLWLVVTGNGRGDYYHEDRDLWDPRTGEYLRVDGGAIVRTRRPPAPGATGDYAGLRVADGVFTYQGAVFDDSRVVFTPKSAIVTPISCGFDRGGWRIRGPTG